MRRAAILSTLLIAGCGATGTHPAAAPRPRVESGSTTTSASGGTTTVPQRRPRRPHPPFAVGLRVVTLVDRGRHVAIPGAGLRPRTLVTVVRYPRAPGRFPLVLFGHGFAVTPSIYAPLLEAWARAGYVVAAPVFRLENADAPGGPNESDIVNQPADMSFVITEMLRSAFFGRRLESHEVAGGGQSDGGNTALAVAYGSRTHDRRVGAAVILSGGEVPRVGELDFSAGGLPLLAIQGTADAVNPPTFTHAFFDGAPTPKYLLNLLGASHLAPYTGVAPWAAVTERVTIAFLDYYLKRNPSGLRRMRTAGDVKGVAALASSP